MTDHQTSPVGEEAERAAPCPFCGGEDIVLYDFSSMICRDCGAEGAVQDDSQTALQAWNRRAALPASVDAEGLPPLPAPDVRQAAAPVPHPTAWSEESVRQAQRDAVASRDVEIADLRAQLAAAQTELDDWLHTNRMDVLQREVASLRAQLEAATKCPKCKGSGKYKDWAPTGLGLVDVDCECGGGPSKATAAPAQAQQTVQSGSIDTSELGILIREAAAQIVDGALNDACQPAEDGDDHGADSFTAGKMAGINALKSELAKHLDGRTAGAVWVDIKDGLPQSGERVLVSRYAGLIANPEHPGYPDKPWLEMSLIPQCFANFLCDLTSTGQVTHWARIAVPSHQSPGKDG